MNIGNYKKPDIEDQEVEGNFDIEDKRENVSTPASTMAEGIKGDLEKDIQEQSSTAKKAKSYDEILKENDIPLDKAHAIVDSILMNGYYEETLPITKTATVTFRTRLHSDYKRYLRALEILNPRYVDEQREIQSRYFLAASLSSFKGQVFEHAGPKDSKEIADRSFEARLDWIEQQPENLILLLLNKLAQFDRTVAVVMSEGVVENF